MGMSVTDPADFTVELPDISDCTDVTDDMELSFVFLPTSI